MNPARLITLQNHCTQSTNGMPSTASTMYRSNSAVTPDVAAHYCQGMPEHWYLAIRMKWAKDWTGANKLEYKLWDEAVKLKTKERWRIEKKYEGREMLRRLAGLAIYEMADPTRFKPDSAWQLKAAWMGVSKKVWFKPWQGRYEMVFDVLNEWTNDAWRYIQKQQAKEHILPEV